MTDSKTKFEIEPDAAPAIPFDFKYIASHWLAIIGMPLGMLPLGDVAINPQAVWFLELVELEEDQSAPGEEPVMVLTGEFGIRAHPAGGGEVAELNSDQSIALEKIIRRVDGEIKKAGHPGSSDDMIDLVGKPQKNSSLVVPPWAKKH